MALETTCHGPWDLAVSLPPPESLWGTPLPLHFRLLEAMGSIVVFIQSYHSLAYFKGLHLEDSLEVTPPSSLLTPRPESRALASQSPANMGVP